MKDTQTTEQKTYYVRKYVNKGSGVGGTYFLAVIGAAVYYLQQATSFGDGVIGLLKALVWPAFLIHQLFQFLHL